jgi:hypothetical protein
MWARSSVADMSAKIFDIQADGSLGYPSAAENIVELSRQKLRYWI